MSEILLSMLEAVDRLNSWVRAESFRRVFYATGLRKRIYEAKREALVAVDRTAAYLAQHRPLTTLVTCRDCRGSGRYEDYGGHVHPHCRACDSTGTRRLRFVESVFYPVAGEDGGRSFRWHSPELSFPLGQHRLGVETSAGDWQVNAPGRDLTADEAARDLLVIDEALPVRRCLCDSWDETCLQHYSLFLGKVETPCAHCGRAMTQDEANNGRCHKSGGRAEFTFTACAGCRRLCEERGGLFDVAMPEQLLEAPNVRRWYEQSLLNPRRERNV